MKISNAMVTCYMDMCQAVRDFMEDPGVTAEDVVLVGNRLCGMYDMILAAAAPSNSEIPYQVELLQETYEKALLRKFDTDVLLK